MIQRGVYEFVDEFDRAQVLTTTAGPNGWTQKTTGSPTGCQTLGATGYVAGNSSGLGTMQGLLAATSEAEVLTMYQKDILIWQLSQLQLVEYTLDVAGIDAVTTLVWGLATAENDTLASVTNSLWFKILGSTSTSNVVIDTTDGTNVNTNIATGVTLSTIPKKFSIDFQNGLTDVRFFINGARVAAGTTFNLNSAAAGQCVQPYVQVQKASGTAVPQFRLHRMRMQARYAYGQ